MVARDILVGGVLAATDKLVKQVGQADWPSAAKTVEQRRMLLDALTHDTPTDGEHEFLKSLRAAAAESEAALAVMSRAEGAPPPTSSKAGTTLGQKGSLCMKA